MEKAKIKASQMFILIVLFEMGSTLLFSVGSQVKQDAWIAILLGLVGGLLIFLIYYRLYRYYPDIPFTSYIQKITGKWLGRFIGFIYIIYYLYQASRVLRDFGELLATTIYTSTPLLVINALMLITIIYGIQKGIEVIARVGELFFAIVYFMGVLGMLLILVSGLIHLENLQPILENGWKPVLITVFGQTITFPFGEMVVFTMLLPYVNDQKKVKMACLGGMLLAGINIIVTTVVNITVLGTDLFIRSTFPLLGTISKIQFANFIERLDVFFMLYLVIGGFFKISIYYYALSIGVTDLFHFKNHRKITFPIGFIIIIASITIATNYAEHIKEGEFIIPYYLHWPFQIIIPVILLIIAFFRNISQKNDSKFSSSNE